MLIAIIHSFIKISDNINRQNIFKPIAVANKQPTSGAAHMEITADIFSTELQPATNKFADSHANTTMFNSNKSMGESATLPYDPYAIFKQLDEEPSLKDTPKKPDNTQFTDDADDFGEFSSAITTVPPTAYPNLSVMPGTALTFYLSEPNNDSGPDLPSNSLNQNQPSAEPGKQSQEWSEFSAFTKDHSKDTGTRNANTFGI